MSSKQIKVDLLFNANTVNAQNNIQQLNTLLNGISKNTTIGIDNGPLSQAVSSAQQLQRYLQQATDVNTGKIDLTKLNSSLQQGKTNLQTLMSQIAMAGPQGEQAFLRIANAVGSAQTPVLQLSARMSGLLKTFANTAKWQVASTAIHAVSGAMTSAISHAKDLDKALNDIRIVTGYGAGTMKTFAAQARDAAKALNTTSTEYAKAALIFYQQGLTGDEVTERADTVIKLSQVTGQTAEQVSSQMTAIWNNFDDGSKSLEYYADVLAKLGAATAASTDEIAQGLEKFAAISDTVGLSYEYATAALATVVDKTRQSADVVGTSFKTIFARIEGLTLGETLEDGTDLNKYSEAMAAVGVNIKESNGDLKKMDTILNELGEKWKVISKDQQIALAQQVGGLRQYNQMIALMDNWDSVQKNINLAADATGELQEQADIWGQSWEAASKRVKANSQELYESFLNSDDITNLTNALADLISGINNAIDAFGGITPLVLTILGLFSQQLFPIITSGLVRLKENFLSLTGISQRRVVATQSIIQAELKARMSAEGVSEALKKQYKLSYDLIEAKKQQAIAIQNTTAAQREELENSMQIVESLNLETQALLEKKQALEASNQAKTSEFSNKLTNTSKEQNLAQVTEKYGVTDSDITYTMGIQKTSQPIGEKISQVNQLEDQRQKNIAETQAIKAQITNGKPTEEQQAKLNYLYKEQQELVLKQGRTWKEIYKDAEGIAQLQGKSHEEIQNMVKATRELEQLNEKGSVSQTVQKIGLGKAGQESTDSIMGDLSQGLQGGSYNAETGELTAQASAENIQNLILKNEDYKAKLESIESIQTDISTVQASRKQLSEEELTLAEKIAAAEKKKNSSEKGSAEYKEATKELKQYEKEIKKYSTSTQGAIRATNNFNKKLISNQEAIAKLATSSGASEEQLRTLNTAFENLKSGKNVNESLQNIETTLGELVQPLISTATSSDQLAKQLIELAKAQGMGDKEIDEWVASLREQGKVTAEVENKIKQLTAAQEDLQDKQNGSTISTQKVIGGITTMASSFMMAASSVSQVTNLIKEGGSAMEWITGICMGLISILPLLGPAIDGVTSAIKKETLATNAGVIAKIAYWMASNPVAGIAILVAVGAAIAGATMIMNKNTKATEENTRQINENKKAQEEQIGPILEAADAYREEADALDALINQYNRMDKASAGVAEAQQKIVEQANTTIEKLKELNKTARDPALTQYIDKLEAYTAAGDVEGIIKASEEANKKANEIAQQSADEFKAMTAAEAEKALVDGANRAKRTSDGVKWATGSAGATGQALADANMMNGRFVKLRTDSNENFVEDYEKLREIEKKLREEGHAGEKQFAKLVEGLDVVQEKYEAIKEQMDTGVQTADLETKLDELGINPADIKTLSQYTDAKEKFAKAAEDAAKANGEDAEEARKAAEEYFDGKSAVFDFVKAQDLVDYVKLERGKDAADKLKETINGLTTEQMEVFLSLNIQEFQTADAIPKLIEAVNAQTKAEKIEARVEFMADFEGFADKTDEELMEIANNAEYGWGTALIDFNNFLSMSAEEQKAYMEQQTEIQTQKLILQQQEVIAKEKEVLATENLTEAEYYNAQQRIKQAETQLAIYEFQQKNREKERRQELKSRQEKIDAFDDEIDRLHEINVLQEDINDQVSKYSKLADQAYGKNKVKNLQEEIKWMQKDLKVQEARVKITEQEMKNRREELESAIPQVQIDDDGRIMNYTQILEEKIRETQKKIASTFDNDKIEQYEKDLEDFREYLDKYEEAAEENQEAIIDLADKEREILDKKLGAIDYVVEVQVEVNDLQLTLLQRQLDRLNDELYDNVERIANLTEQFNENYNNIGVYKSGIEKILSEAGADQSAITNYFNGDASGIKGLNLSDAQIQQIQKYTEEIANSEKALRELDIQVEEQSMTTFNAWHEKIAENAEVFDHASSMAQSYKNIIDLIGKDSLGIDESLLRQLEQTQIDAANGKLANAKTQMETTQKDLNKANEELAKAIERAEKAGLNEETIKGTEYEADIKKWQDDVDAINKQLMTDQQDFMNSWENSLQVAAEVFQQQMERAFDDLQDELAGSFKSLNELQTSWEQDQAVADRYLDNGEKLYELSKLNRKIQQDMDNTDSVAAQKELLELQKIISAYNSDGAKISKAELEALQKKYDLKVAEIALEEAQNAKSVVRMRRDSEGNYGYVYTADENKTVEAQQNYEDQLEANRKLAEDQSKELTDKIIQNRQEMVAALREINIADYANQEEYLAAIAEKTKFYKDQEAYLVEQYQAVIGRSQLIYAQDFAEYEGWSGKKVDSSNLLKEVLGDNEDEMGQNTWGFVEEHGNAMEAMGIAYNGPKIKAEELNKALGTGTGEGGTGYYDQMLASAAAWASGMGARSAECGAAFDLILGSDEGEEKSGIKGVIAELGDTTTGYYGDLISGAKTFIGTKDTDGTWTYKMNEASSAFSLITNSASEVWKNLGAGTKDGTGTFSNIIGSGSTFVSNLNAEIGKVDFTPVSTKAEGMETALGWYNGTSGTGAGFLGTAGENAANWQGAVDSIMSEAGTSVDGFKGAVNTAINGENGFADIIDDAKEKTGEYGKTATEQFAAATNSIITWQSTTSPKLEEAKTDTDNLYLSLVDLKDLGDFNIKVDLDLSGLDSSLEQLEEYLNSIPTSRNIQITASTSGAKEHNRNTALKQIASGFNNKDYYLDEKTGNVYEGSQLSNITTDNSGNVTATIKDTAVASSNYLGDFKNRTSEMTSGQAQAFRASTVDMNSYVTDRNGNGKKYYRVSSYDNSGKQIFGYVSEDDVKEDKIGDVSLGTFHVEKGAQIYSSIAEQAKEYKIKGISDPYMNDLNKTLVLLDDGGVYWYNGGALKGDTNDKVSWTSKELNDRRVRGGSALFYLNGQKLKNGETERFYFNPADFTAYGASSEQNFYNGFNGGTGKGRKWLNRSGKENSSPKNASDDNKIFVSDSSQQFYYQYSKLNGYKQSFEGDVAAGQHTPPWTWALNNIYLNVGKDAQKYAWKKFDTGGYTGEWGPEGKLAVLHQKEIVLNAADTENFLTAIDMVRSMSNQLDQKVALMRYQNALDRFQAAFTTGNEILEQNVHITAEFPNATNHNEIEEAFRNLTNLASQYINRK